MRLSHNLTQTNFDLCRERRTIASMEGREPLAMWYSRSVNQNRRTQSRLNCSNIERKVRRCGERLRPARQTSAIATDADRATRQEAGGRP